MRVYPHTLSQFITLYKFHFQMVELSVCLFIRFLQLFADEGVLKSFCSGCKIINPWSLKQKLQQMTLYLFFFFLSF